MKFETIKITGGQVDTPDPRSTPATVPPTHIKVIPQTLPNSDWPPGKVVLAMEGTPAQTVTVQQYLLDESSQVNNANADNPKANDAARLFYPFGAAQVVTCPTAVAIATVPGGQIYFRLTSAPAADAVLKIGYAP